MLGKKEIAAVERRATAARLTMAELCKLVEVPHSSWSRAKARGSIRPTLIRKFEQALAAREVPS